MNITQRTKHAPLLSKIGQSVLVAISLSVLSQPLLAVETIDTSCGVVTTSIMPSGDLANSGNADFKAIIGFDYDLRGELSTSPNRLEVASAREVGTVWGKAYNANTQMLYASAFLRRHAPLSPDGLGAIYEIDVSDTSSDATIGTPSLWMDLNTTAHLGSGATLFPSETPANRGLGSPFAPSHDVWAYTRVAKQGLGGLEISDDYTTLYAMDMTNRQLLEIDIASKTVANRYPVNDPGCTGGSGNVRPFGVSESNGEVYIGVTCSGETTQSDNDVSNYVMRLSGGSFVTVVDDDLYRWDSHWTDDAYGGGSCSSPSMNGMVPIITNMEFDDSGNMVIGYTSANGWRWASLNYPPNTACTDLTQFHETNGYIVRATPTGSGDWEVTGAEFVTHTSLDPNRHYYDGQAVLWGSSTPQAYHTYTGGMDVADCSGTEVMLVNVMDPINFQSSGTRWMRTSDGSADAATNTGDMDSATLIAATLEHYYGAGDEHWEKSSGLGDIEYLRTSTVCSLTASATVSACTNGGNDSDASNDTFTIDLTVEGVNTGASTTYNYTSTSANISGSGTYSATAETDGPFVITATTTPFDLTITDSADSNCTVPVTNIVAPATCSSANPQIDLEVSKTVSPTSVSSGDSATYTITVTNNGPDNATGVQVSDQLPAGVSYMSDTPSQGTYTQGTGIWVVGDVANGASATLTIQVTAD